ncbi:MAG: polysaccharide deacetylase family protein [Defluviitaleaceae bacterium]|nr:polysaccharide deacetylase family protein [Defluviitaleaceae bacterium]
MKNLLVIISFVFLVGCTGQYSLWFPIIPVEEVFPIEEAFVEEYETPIIEDYYKAESYIEEPDNELPQEVYIDEERKPMIAITFDDGPGRYTNRILDILEENGGRATFFVIGYRVEPHRDIILRATELGNEIANHSWSHPRLPHINDEAIVEEILSASAAIEAVTGYSPPIMRPPFGRTSAGVRQIAEELGYVLVNWTIDTLDWQYRDADRIYSVIMNEVEDGAIILLHDIHTTTAAAMEKVIPRLVAEGFQLVTVSELLDYFYEGLESGQVYGKLVEIDD